MSSPYPSRRATIRKPNPGDTSSYGLPTTRFDPYPTLSDPDDALPASFDPTTFSPTDWIRQQVQARPLLTVGSTAAAAVGATVVLGGIVCVKAEQRLVGQMKGMGEGLSEVSGRLEQCRASLAKYQAAQGVEGASAASGRTGSELESRGADAGEGSEAYQESVDDMVRSLQQGQLVEITMTDPESAASKEEAGSTSP
ncbi:hypothetical protein IAT38_004626 [Cryptococcus sp. DSM 104549]